MRTAAKGSLLILACWTMGCEGPIEFAGDPFTPELVVTSEFSTQSPWYAVVQRTVGFEEVVSLPTVVENASVTISGSDGSLVELEHKGGGFYQSDCCRPETGITYELAVEADGFAKATAIDMLPAPTEIQAVRRTSAVREGQPTTRLEVDIKDDGSTRNYYELSIIYDPRWYILEFTILNAEIKDQLQEFGVGDILLPDLTTVYVHRMLLHDDVFNGKDVTLILETYPSGAVARVGGSLSVKLRTVSEAYYQYWRTQMVQNHTRKDPFAEPVMVQSNITGGHGVFAGYAPETYGELSDAVMREQVSGSYKLTKFEGIEDGVSNSYIALGGSGELEISNDNTVLGAMEIPIGDGDPRSASLDGGFLIRGPYIRLFHSAKTALQDMELTFSPESGHLNGSLTIDWNQGVYVRFSREDGE